MFHVSHTGIIVADLERATRFWCDGLGFERGLESHPGSEISRLSEFEGATDMLCRFVGKGGLRIELMQLRAPRAIPSPGRRPLNQIGGPAHIALRVDDMDAALTRVRDHGGQVLDFTRTRYRLFETEDIELCYALDPDDVRLSLSMLGPRGRAIVNDAAAETPG